MSDQSKTEWTWEKVDEMQKELAAHRELERVKSKPTGEWTVETVDDLLDYKRRNSQAVADAHNASLDELRIASNAALESAKRESAKEIAYEREHGMDDLRALTHATIDRLAKENEQLREQLAAAVGSLKEARETMAARNGVGQFDDEIERIDAALAKVKP